MPKVNYNELKENIQDSIYITIEATGTNNYVASSSLITSLKSKRTRFTLFVANDSTGNCTLNLNSFGAKNIKDANGNIVKNLKKNIPYNVVYNGQDFILQGKGGGGNAQPGDVRQGKKFTNDNGEQVGTRTNLDIAKELGINAEAKNVIKGYKVLDKNGNVVVGTATLADANGGSHYLAQNKACLESVIDDTNESSDPYISSILKVGNIIYCVRYHETYSSSTGTRCYYTLYKYDSNFNVIWTKDCGNYPGNRVELSYSSEFNLLYVTAGYFAYVFDQKGNSVSYKAGASSGAHASFCDGHYYSCCSGSKRIVLSKLSDNGYFVRSNEILSWAGLDNYPRSSAIYGKKLFVCGSFGLLRYDIVNDVIDINSKLVVSSASYGHCDCMVLNNRKLYTIDDGNVVRIFTNLDTTPTVYKSASLPVKSESYRTFLVNVENGIEYLYVLHSNNPNLLVKWDVTNQKVVLNQNVNFGIDMYIYGMIVSDNYSIILPFKCGDSYYLSRVSQYAYI